MLVMNPFPDSISSRLDDSERCVLINIMWGTNEQAIDKLGRKVFSAMASLLTKLECDSVDEVRMLVKGSVREEVNIARVSCLGRAHKVGVSLPRPKSKRLSQVV